MKIIVLLGAMAAATTSEVLENCSEAARPAVEQYSLIQVQVPPSNALVQTEQDRDVVIESWNSIASNIKLLNWDWSKTSFKTNYGYIGTGIYGTMGAFGALNSAIKGNMGWNEAIIMTGKAFVPLVGAINPIAGVCFGLFMAFFTSGTSKADELDALYEMLMEQVEGMITDALVQEQVKEATAKLSSLMKITFENPRYVDETPTDDKKKSDWYGWYVERQADYNNGIYDVFSVNCVDSQFQPIWPSDDVCKEFSAQGTLMQQIQYAQAHLNTYQAAAQFADSEDLSKQEIAELDLNRRMYANLLTASLSNWLDNPASPPDCKWDLPKGWGEYYTHPYKQTWCKGCTATLTDEAQGVYTYTGENVMTATGCSSSCYGEEYWDQPSDICSTDRDGCSGSCTYDDYNKQVDAWKVQAKLDMLPWVRAFQIDFTAETNASGKECACENGAPAYSVSEVNASSCQKSCRQDLHCRAFQFNALVDGVLNYSSSEIGTCSLFSCVKEEWSACTNSDQCPMGTSCRVGDKRCSTQEDCDWANSVDGTTRDCTAIPRTISIDDGASCTSSDECVGLTSFCRVGDHRCLTDEQCAAAGVADCTKMPKTAPAGTIFSKLSGYQNCQDYDAYAAFEVTDLAACMNYCGISCNALGFLGTTCYVHEGCVPTVVYKSTEKWEYYMKELPTKADEGQACANVDYSTSFVTISESS